MRPTYSSLFNIPFIVFLFLLILAGLNCQQGSSPVQQDILSKVNPFIGTAGKGKTYPGASVPYGMVQLSPDNGRNGWDWISGYFYPDSVIAGFSHLHLTGTGAGDLYDISFLPTSGPLIRDTLDDIAGFATVYSRFSHEREQASPGYYEVFLEDYEVNVHLTATARTGLQYYQYNRPEAKIRLDLSYTRNWDRVTDSHLRILNDSTVVGYRNSSGWAADQRVYFVSVFSQPISDAAISLGGKVVQTDSVSGTQVLGVFDFGTATEVMVKTGISSVSIDNALENLTAEQTGFDFETVHQQARALWLTRLEKVRIQASPDNEMQFYTAMYHSMLAPVLFSDINGQYKGADGQIHQVTGHNRYTLFSLWDTYRALHPWLTLTQPEQVQELMHSFMDFYGEYGKLPVWNMHGNETNMMMGYHSVPVLADAFQKGLTDLDSELMFEAMKKSAMQEEFGIGAFRDKGYVPYEVTSWNVSRSLEYAYDDWCIAQVAEALGKQEEAAYFSKRAQNYRQHFDPKTGFFRARSEKGQFKEPFDPLAYHPEDYCEANAWQYLWYVPQDVAGLVDLMGGEQAFGAKLDEMFEVMQEQEKFPDWISGYIGQYVHGNEPSHHVPYLYQYIGQPHKTQTRVRQIMDELYTTAPDGLCGNEDCGQMSAWYLFSALGFYPVNPADGKYILGSPEVEEAWISLPGDKTFHIIAQNAAQEHLYVNSVSLNGKTLDRPYLLHEEIMAGGELVFEMKGE